MTDIHYTDDIVLAPTAVSTWLRCPQMYKQKYEIPDVVKLGGYAASVIQRYRRNDPFMSAAKDTRHMLLQMAAIEAADATRTLLGSPLHTELTLGRCRVDEVFFHQKHVIMDYKYHPSGLSVGGIERHYGYSHQLMHYAWAFSQYSGMWIVPPACELTIGVCVFGESYRPIIQLWPVSYNRLRLWLDEATTLWQLIPRLGRAYRQTQHCVTELYGICPMYIRCWGALEHDQRGSVS